MPSQPLTALLLLLYLLLVAAALTTWFALAPQRPPRPPSEAEETGVEQDDRPDETEAKALSNDDVRGARARPGRRAKDDEDPFDRFIRSKNDDIRL